MDETLKAALLKIPTDLPTALSRVANKETIYVHLLHKFIEDTNFTNLKQCLAARQYDEAFPFAHTLKGVSGNLGFLELYHQADLVVEHLRIHDTTDIDVHFSQLEQAYHTVISILQQYLT